MKVDIELIAGAVRKIFLASLFVIGTIQFMFPLEEPIYTSVKAVVWSAIILFMLELMPTFVFMMGVVVGVMPDIIAGLVNIYRAIVSFFVRPIVNKYEEREYNYEQIIKNLQKQISVYELSKQKQEIKDDQKKYREKTLREKYPDLVEALDNSISSYQPYETSYFVEPEK